MVLETLVLSILNHDSAIASAASRMTSAAGDRPCIEMGSRRTHEEAAVAAARAAYVAGFATTSNLEAGRRFGVPTAGTAAHAFTLLHDDEREAFTAQIAALGKGTTLLVDTYDVPTAVALAVELAGPELGGVRLDSGDLLVQAREVRDQLDRLGATQTQIVVTSDLDEYAIAALAAGPVDRYGVGTSLVTGLGRPDGRHGLQARGARGRRRRRWSGSPRRARTRSSVGGRKYALRRRNAKRHRRGRGASASASRPLDDGDDRELLVPAHGWAARDRLDVDPRGRPRARTPPPAPSSPPRPGGCSAASP